jgi:hypothetical protein
LGGTRIGALIPDVINNETNVILKVHDWKTSNLIEIASIVIRKYPQKGNNWQCMPIHYDSSNDTILMWDGDLQGSGADAGALTTFKLS